MRRHADGQVAGSTPAHIPLLFAFVTDADAVLAEAVPDGQGPHGPLHDDGSHTAAPAVFTAVRDAFACRPASLDPAVMAARVNTITAMPIVRFMIEPPRWERRFTAADPHDPRQEMRQTDEEAGGARAGGGR